MLLGSRRSARCLQDSSRTHPVAGECRSELLVPYSRRMLRAPHLGLAFLLGASCGGVPMTAMAPPQQGGGGVAKAVAGAGDFIDDAKCDATSDALRPFVMQWDPSTAAEFQGHAEGALAVVKLRGCQLELLETCHIPGEYRVTQTSGNLATLRIDQESRLYAKLPLAVASLDTQLKQSGSLAVKYYVAGMAYATAPVLYRSQLGPGCDGATHLVLNYAAGAHEVSSAASMGAGAEAKSFVAGAGAATKGSTGALLSGGQFEECASHSKQCTVPVRLHLVPILDGDPPAGPQGTAALAATTRPAAGDSSLPPRPVETLMSAIALASPAFKTCYNRLLERSNDSGRMQVDLGVGADGVVNDVAVVPAGATFDADFTSCIKDVCRSVRFPPAPQGVRVRIPIVFQRP